MMRFPLIPTVLVAAAVASMIGLGVWQLQRKGEKEALIAQYRAAASLPPVAFPSVPRDDGNLLYRRATGFCVEPLGWRAIAGRNEAGETGWSHIAACRTGGLEGPGMLRYVEGGKRYTPGDWPTDPLPIFEEEGSVTVYDEVPETDVLPDYPPWPGSPAAGG